MHSKDITQLHSAVGLISSSDTASLKLLGHFTLLEPMTRNWSDLWKVDQAQGQHNKREVGNIVSYSSASEQHLFELLWLHCTWAGAHTSYKNTIKSHLHLTSNAWHPGGLLLTTGFVAVLIFPLIVGCSDRTEKHFTCLEECNHEWLLWLRPMSSNQASRFNIDTST